MGNCIANRTKYPVLLRKSEKSQLELTFMKCCLRNPQSRNNGLLSEENLTDLFKDIPKLGIKIHWLMQAYQQQPGITFDTFLQIIELPLLGKSENQHLQNLNRVQFCMLATTLYAQLNIFDQLSNIMELEITYLEALDCFSNFQKMRIQRKVYDEQAAKAFLDGIFAYNPFINLVKLSQFFMSVIPNLDSIVEDYFWGKFMDRKQIQQSTPILQDPSHMLNIEWITLMQLTLFTAEQQGSCRLQLLYSSVVHEKNFSLVANLLHQCHFPTLTLCMTHDVQSKPHMFGGFTNEKWCDDASPNGCKDDVLFQMYPLYRVLHAKHDKFTRPQYTYLNSKNDDLKLGLGFGGEFGKDFRIWVDKDLESVTCSDHDKTFEGGTLINQHLRQSQLKVLEIWTVQQIRGSIHIKELMLRPEESESFADFDEFQQPQMRLDEEISSFHSGEYSQFSDQQQIVKEDSCRWEGSSSQGFEEVIVNGEEGDQPIEKPQVKKEEKKVNKQREDDDDDDESGGFEEVALQSQVKQNEKKKTQFQVAKIDSSMNHQRVEVDHFVNEKINSPVAMQASTFEKDYAVVSGVFGSANNSNWDGEESSTWKGNGSMQQSSQSKVGGRSNLCRDLEAITEELKESTNTQG